LYYVRSTTQNEHMNVDRCKVGRAVALPPCLPGR